LNTCPVDIKRKYYWKKLIGLRAEYRIYKKAQNCKSGYVTGVGKISKKGLNKKIAQLEKDLIYYMEKLWTEKIV